MGFDSHGVRFLVGAASSGVSFQRTLMVGRQEMHLSYRDLREQMEDAGFVAPAQDGRFSEPFLRALGAEDIASLDASDFEGASVVHDMNRPIPDELKRRFSVVIDGGSLEHVFDFAQAIRNCIEMIEPGGHYLAISPANNFMGHGFYQFSPELYFRVFSETNGFRMERVFAVEARAGAPWYEIQDPATVGRRILLRNSHETYVLVRACRMDVRDFRIPQQSDYAVAWEGSDASVNSSLRRVIERLPVANTSFRSLVFRVTARLVPNVLRRAFRRGFDRRFYTPYK